MRGVQAEGGGVGAAFGGWGHRPQGPGSDPSPRARGSSARHPPGHCFGARTHQVPALALTCLPGATQGRGATWGKGRASRWQPCPSPLLSGAGRWWHPGQPLPPRPIQSGPSPQQARRHTLWSPEIVRHLRPGGFINGCHLGDEGANTGSRVAPADKTPSQTVSRKDCPLGRRSPGPGGWAEGGRRLGAGPPHWGLPRTRLCRSLHSAPQINAHRSPGPGASPD